MLQDNTKLHARLFGHGDQMLRTFEADLQRLFQEDMFAGFRGAPHEIEMGVGRREQQNRLDRRVSENRFDAIDNGKAVSLRKSQPSLGAWTESSRDFDAIHQFLKALRVRCRCHAQPDDTDPFHADISLPVLPG